MSWLESCVEIADNSVGSLGAIIDSQLARSRQGLQAASALHITYGTRSDETLLVIRQDTTYAHHTHVEAEAPDVVPKARMLEQALRAKGRVGARVECYALEPVAIGPGRAMSGGDYRPVYGRFIKQGDIRFDSDVCQKIHRPKATTGKVRQPSDVWSRLSSLGEEDLLKVLEALG
jgi:hypothetical protein